jgi:uncharacterized GH25 family protein
MKQAYQVATLLAIAMQAAAHETWLMPERFSVDPGTTLAMDLTSGSAFPALDAAIEPSRVTKAAYRVARHTADLTALTPAEHSLRLNATLGEAGIATLWVDLAPRTIELAPKDVEEYLTEIGASDLVKQRWLATPGKRWREMYSKHAKAFVRVGDGGSDRSWSEPVGMFLEIVPQSDPTKLVAGGELIVEVLRDGGTIPSFSIAMSREGSPGQQMQKTDGGGLATFKLDAAGRWLVHGTLLRAMPGPDVEWESHFAALTVDVAAP